MSQVKLPMQRLAIQSPILTMESARQLVEKVCDQRDSLAWRERPAQGNYFL
jgi:hypothetical protein